MQCGCDESREGAPGPHAVLTQTERGGGRDEGDEGDEGEGEGSTRIDRSRAA